MENKEKNQAPEVEIHEVSEENGIEARPRGGQGEDITEWN